MSDHPDEPAAERPTESAEPAVNDGVSDGVRDGQAVVVPARRPRRRTALVAGSVLLAAAVVAGVATTVAVVRDADVDAGAPVWRFPDDKPVEAEPAPANGLGRVLVPYGTDGWTRGPDYGEFGADAELNGQRAQALRKEGLSDLPRTLRRQLEKAYDKHPLKGMALRVYYNGEPSGIGKNDDIYEVSLVLTRMDSRAQAADLTRVHGRLLDSVALLRKGPPVKGHKDAKCFLASDKEDDTGLESMFCVASREDVTITVKADGVRPLDGKGVAMLLATQLDRIAETGKAV